MLQINQITLYELLEARQNQTGSDFIYPMPALHCHDTYRPARHASLGGSGYLARKRTPLMVEQPRVPSELISATMIQQTHIYDWIRDD